MGLAPDREQVAKEGSSTSPTANTMQEGWGQGHFLARGARVFSSCRGARVLSS